MRSQAVTRMARQALFARRAGQNIPSKCCWATSLVWHTAHAWHRVATLYRLRLLRPVTAHLLVQADCSLAAASCGPHALIDIDVAARPLKPAVRSRQHGQADASCEG